MAELLSTSIMLPKSPSEEAVILVSRNYSSRCAIRDVQFSLEFKGNDNMLSH